MIHPSLTDDAFLADIARPAISDTEVRIWWLGQSGFLILYRNESLLIDPYLSDSLTTKYAATDKPHVRMTARVIDPARLTPIHLIASTHNHTDHLDAETIEPLLRTNPGAKLIIPEANRSFVSSRVKIRPDHLIMMDDGTRANVGAFEFHGIAAAHNELLRDENGRHHCLGYVIQCGTRAIYHSGDTLNYPALATKLRGFSINTALLPINGNKPERRVAGNLDGREAALLAHEIGARRVIPCHYDMFEFNTADPREAFVPECERLHQPYVILRAGEGLALD